MRDFLLKVKVNDIKLFVAVEQGGEKHKNNIIVIVNYRAKILVRKWIIEEYRKSLRVQWESNYNITILPY